MTFPDAPNIPDFEFLTPHFTPQEMEEPRSKPMPPA